LQVGVMSFLRRQQNGKKPFVRGFFCYPTNYTHTKEMDLMREWPD